jgi:hypothetical protein
MPVIRMRHCRNPACRQMVQCDSVCPGCGTPHGKSHKAAKVKHRVRTGTSGRSSGEWWRCATGAAAAPTRLRVARRPGRVRRNPRPTSPPRNRLPRSRRDAVRRRVHRHVRPMPRTNRRPPRRAAHARTRLVSTHTAAPLSINTGLSIRARTNSTPSPALREKQQLVACGAGLAHGALAFGFAFPAVGRAAFAGGAMVGCLSGRASKRVRRGSLTRGRQISEARRMGY